MFNMNTDNNIRLLYELNAKSAQLDLAIQQAELQLANVNGKLQTLWHDVAIWVVAAVLPVAVYLLGSGVYSFFLMAFSTILKGVYLMALPVILYQLGKAVYLLKLNREDAADYEEPVRLGTLRDGQLGREPSYRAEQKKLVCILTRYYMGRDTISQIRKQITDSDSCTMTMAELYEQLSVVVFYEEVRPAQAFGGKTGGSIVFPMILSMAIGLIYVFYVWSGI